MAGIKELVFLGEDPRELGFSWIDFLAGLFLMAGAYILLVVLFLI
jgi:hypothetical protein